ncbi:MAG: hypothetical protein U9R19_13430, partial [Bacteroidota bacterium]|nr:hypothetical protein [Bacteroidota bacterium]
KIMVENYAVEHSFKVAETLTQNEYLDEVARQSGMETREFIQYLWTQQDPSKFWYVVIFVGMFAAFCLFLYDRFLLKEGK